MTALYTIPSTWCCHHAHHYHHRLLIFSFSTRVLSQQTNVTFSSPTLSSTTHCLAYPHLLPHHLRLSNFHHRKYTSLHHGMSDHTYMVLMECLLYVLVLLPTDMLRLSMLHQRFEMYLPAQDICRGMVYLCIKSCTFEDDCDEMVTDTFDG